jgi:GntR family transcriptional regulator, transcriptional repressor for pyruvate dehydrogenase complex
MSETTTPSPGRRRRDVGPDRPPPRPERPMDVEPIKSTRIYEEIVRQIKAMIGEGRLKSGDQLPPERELAEKFLVSRTSVREALRALESLGLVEIRPGEGTFVREV